MDVVLINKGGNCKPAAYQGTAIINQALKEVGITPEIYSIDEFSAHSLKEKSIVGLGAYYEELDEFMKLGKKLQDLGHYVVLGGHSTMILRRTICFSRRGSLMQ